MAADPRIFDDVPLFALLDADERAVLAHNVEVKNFKAGEPIYRSGEPGGRAYIVQHGSVEVSVQDEAGEKIIIQIAERGDVFGIASMLAEADHLTTALAIEDACAIEVDRNDLMILFQQKPHAALDILTMVEKHLRSSHELLRSRVVRNPNVEIEAAETFGDRLADSVARFGGSWTFVILFGVTLAVYATVNLFIPNPWDPYPFILLNLFLSMLAAIQAPVIMMSQNRQDAKDRVRSELDYQVNLKAEAEITEVLARVSRIEEHIGMLSNKK